MTDRRDWFTTPLSLYDGIVIANIIVFARTQTSSLQTFISKNVAHFHLNSDMVKSIHFIKSYTFWKMYVLMKCHVEKNGYILLIAF